MHKRVASLFSLPITLTLAATGCDMNAIELEPDPEPLFIAPGATNPGSPDTSDPAVCTGAELHVVGSHQAGGSLTPFEDIVGEATVRVARPGPAILVLSNYNPVHWTVIAEEGATIERVILSGFDAGTATVPDGVPVDVISYETTGTYWPFAAFWPDDAERGQDCEEVIDAESCARYAAAGLDWRAATEQPDWAVDALVAEAERVTGAALTTFHGCYYLHDLTIVPHENGAAPAVIPATCKEEPIDAHFAEVPAEVPADGGGETCGAPLPVREVPTEGPCAGKAEQGNYQFSECGDSAADGVFISGASGETLGIFCEHALQNCELNAGLNPELNFICTFDGEVIYAASTCEP